MRNYKVVCLVETQEKGKHEYTIFIKADSIEEAEFTAKYYFIKQISGYVFWNAKAEKI